jgi:hypothetical protein
MTTYMRNTLDWETLIKRANLKKGCKKFISSFNDEDTLIIKVLGEDNKYSLLMTCRYPLTKNFSLKDDFICYVKTGKWE